MEIHDVKVSYDLLLCNTFCFVIEMSFFVFASNIKTQNELV